MSSHLRLFTFYMASLISILTILMVVSWPVSYLSIQSTNVLPGSLAQAQFQNPCIIPKNSSPIKNATSSLSNYLLYENLPFGVRIEFPKGMEVDEHIDDPCKWTQDPNIYSYYDIARISVSEPNDTSGILLTVGRVGSQSLEDYLDVHLQFYGETRENFQLQQADMNSVLSNNTAYMLVYTNVENGKDLKWLEVGTIVNKKVFYVQYYAPLENFSYNLPTIYTMMNSFKILETDQDYSSSLSTQPDNGIKSDPSVNGSQPGTSLRNTVSSYMLNETRVDPSLSDPHRLIMNEDPANGIKILAPQSWKKEANVTSNLNDVIHIMKFDSMARVPYSENVVLSRNLINEDDTLDVYTAKKIQSYKQDPEYLSFSVISTNLEGEFLGMPAYEILYTTVNPHGGTDIVLNREIGTMIENQVYYITYSALISRYSEFLPIVEKMVKSVKLDLPSLSSAFEQELEDQQQHSSAYVPEI